MAIKDEVEFGDDWVNTHGWTIYISWIDGGFLCEKDGMDDEFFYSLADAVKHCKDN